jgi:hypothetical protein
MILISPPSKFDAICSLVGNNKHFSVSPNDEFKWLEDTDEGKPTEDEIQAELSKLNLQWSAEEYSRNRRREFPSITDVVVALAEKAEGKSQMWDEITALRLDVKSRFPKK